MHLAFHNVRLSLVRWRTVIAMGLLILFSVAMFLVVEVRSLHRTMQRIETVLHIQINHQQIQRLQTETIRLQLQQFASMLKSGPVPRTVITTEEQEGR